ncbi:outer membrane beta-barrel family protein [Flavobacterium sp.]|uniref:outer membrane beta-barrel family protein n=1 Tax=Flavobacterium sp. TaxID=239 RepID=UPI0008CE3759|nr:outer membrane beta-barrel family protein [Flavobacterium sp.]OGS63746.1 MAG: TonB-dependent receptor [Flavobacteria bacterium GWA2_35_26]HCF04073.1 TonB-dependent receptor [Flavobacterium sp.]
MKKLNAIALIVLFLSSILSFGQQPPMVKAKLKITGKVIEKTSKQALEYATITLRLPNNPKAITGGITNNKGEFSVEAAAGTYDITIEFISFKSTEIKGKTINSNTNLGTIGLAEDAAQLNEVVIRAEKTTVEIKLDKKVFNVGSDLMVKGGTVSDVLGNIPSVSVDVEGNVSLRGNENVKILIDGRPSNAINIIEALRIIPADAIDKVEVITNPSARYDAEGGGGILNIVLKKGKNLGFNGTFIATGGIPDNNGLSGNVNYKTKKVSLFTTQGYSFRSNPGNMINETTYFNSNNSIRNFIVEPRENDRYGKGYNGNFGVDIALDEKTFWTNTFNYRNNNSDNTDRVFQNYFTSTKQFDYTRNRINKEDSDSENIEYTTNFVKNFKKEGHKFTIDGSISSNDDANTAIVTETGTNTSTTKLDNTINNQKQDRVLIQSDYVLPLGKGSQFEAGYRGDFSKLVTDYQVKNDGIINLNFTNVLEYKEKINAVYTQYGFKKNKASVLLGLRYEDSNIEINQLATSDFNTKKYGNLFPSAFFTYELSDKASTSISYSRRIQRPRGRMLNPFSNLSSNINIFVGNPDLDPSMTDAIDFGYIKRWSKLTLSTSLYYNKTTDVFQMARRESGNFVNGTPIIITSPINIATEFRTGFEFTLNYSPYKWWKLNSNFNFFQSDTKGDFVYTNFNNVVVTQRFNNNATSWFSRLTSKITLPSKIDWQTNLMYMGGQTNAQGKVLGNFSANLAFSKDVFKDKGTFALNVNDVFNGRKRIMETYLPGVLSSRAEMQWRVRQVTLSFTYRFNKSKNEREKQPKKMNEGGGEMEYQG